MRYNKFMTKKLTLKQKTFAHEYLRTGNATEAAGRIYNVKDRTVAASVGCENLRKPYIAEYIEQLLANRDGLTVNDAFNALSEVVNAPTPPLASYSEKLAGTKLLLQLHKALPASQPTVHVSTHFDPSALAARVAAQEKPIDAQVVEAEEVIDTEDE